MSGRFRIAGLLAVAAMALAVVATASPASAHATLETMNPGPGATLKDLPATVVLTFSEVVRTPAFVQVTNADGVDVTKGDVRIVDKEVMQTLGDPAGSGRYSVSYRITSADGHPVGGTVDFTVLSSAGGDGGDSGDGGTAASQDDGSQPSASDESGGISTTQLLLLLGVLVVGLVVLAVATRRALSQSAAMVEERRRAEEKKKRGRSRRP
jgi:copper resistance protein C